MFESILFLDASEYARSDNGEAPACFPDLNLDQVAQEIAADWQPYNLMPFFYTPLRDVSTITYRHEVMQDLEKGPLIESVRAFSDRMRRMRRYLERSDKSYYKYEKEGWFLAAVDAYCEALEGIQQEVSRYALGSRGMREFREFLGEYLGSSKYTKLLASARKLKIDLAGIFYCLHIDGNRITVRNYENEADYSTVIEETFDRFRRGAVRDYRLRFPKEMALNHVEGQILDRVALLNPEIFAALDSFCQERADYCDQTVARFDREIQFYVAYLAYINKLRRLGLSFCYPVLSTTSKEVSAHNCFDLALASKFAKAETLVVRNDFFLTSSERMFVVSGPNQGGKTTFARMFGQVHYLASLGCPVPGTDAQLFLCDQILTHFEKQEDINTLRGKLQDDLIRIREILEKVTPSSVVIMNEIFASTTLKDALYLSRNVISQLSERDALAVCVSFLSELASLNDKTVSVVSLIDPRDPAIRTYKLERMPADGLAYALALAEKYRVTYDALKERIR